MAEDRVADLLKDVERAVRQFEQAFLGVAFIDPDDDEGEPFSKDEAVLLLFGVREVVARLKYADEAIVDLCRELGLNDPHAAPGQGVATGKWGKERKTWHHPELTSVAAERILASFVDRETGEIDLPPPHVLVTSILDYAHVDYWRKGKMAELGVDIDEYCTVSPARYSVQLTTSQRAGSSFVADE